MKVEFQGKTYTLRGSDLTELREMVASDMHRPLWQDKPISYHKVKNYDIEDFMGKYFVREVKREDIVDLCYEELKRRADKFLPLKSFDKDAYKFALIQLSEVFCQYRLSFFIAPTYFDTFNEWLDKFTFIRLENRRTEENIYFLCDFSKATFDVDMHLQSRADVLIADIRDAFDNDIFHPNRGEIAKELENRFLTEFCLLD